MKNWKKTILTLGVASLGLASGVNSKADDSSSFSVTLPNRLISQAPLAAALPGQLPADVCKWTKEQVAQQVRNDFNVARITANAQYILTGVKGFQGSELANAVGPSATGLHDSGVAIANRNGNVINGMKYNLEENKRGNNARLVNDSDPNFKEAITFTRDQDLDSALGYRAGVSVPYLQVSRFYKKFAASLNPNLYTGINGIQFIGAVDLKSGRQVSFVRYSDSQGNKLSDSGTFAKKVLNNALIANNCPNADRSGDSSGSGSGLFPVDPGVKEYEQSSSLGTSRVNDLAAIQDSNGQKTQNPQALGEGTLPAFRLQGSSSAAGQ